MKMSDTDLSEISTADAKEIQAIDKASVHRICSGQVVLNLATAIKELVENSLDAGATNIEIRLKDHGSELVEVVDNGSGVEEQNFAGLTLKHHTSKLKDFSDLVNVDTFGFRGEALSSLCALSKLTIVTCYEKVSVGSRIEYNHNGKIIKQSRCARQKGTTVILENLFSTLPVRHKEFVRNIKREFAKAVQILNAYCMISTGVRITCTNQIGKGKKNVVVSTGGNMNSRENITNVFGAKQVQSLLAFEQIDPNEEVCTEYGVSGGKQMDSKAFNISGYLSSSEHGQGRSASDRQFYFINRRPCDPQKISRLVNEVYHMYNRHQYPFVMMDISLAKESVDVNVTPDKRQIFVQEERLLLAIIKGSLMKMFEPNSSLYRINQVSSKSSSFSNSFSKSPLKHHLSSPDTHSMKSLTPTLANLKRSFSSAFAREADEANVELVKQRKLDNFLMPKTNTEAENSTTEGQESQSATSSEYAEIIGNHISEDLVTKSDLSVSEARKDFIVDSLLDTAIDSQSSGLGSSTTDFLEILGDDLTCTSVKELPGDEKQAISGKECRVVREINNPSYENDIDDDRIIPHEQHSLSTDIVSDIDDSLSTSTSEIVDTMPGHAMPGHSQQRKTVDEDKAKKSRDPQIIFTEFDDEKSARHIKEQTVSFSFASISKKINSKRQKGGQRLCRNFRARINPSDNTAAEEELQREISKDMFGQMEILGQFNLGFIITRLGRDLFIIDQHATDEKYNFERLQRDTVIRGQRLIQPQNLELTASNECILMDNVAIFQHNGFEFVIDEDAPATQRVKLITMPVSKNWTFGKDDIEELIFMLTDSPGVMCRPSRVRQMFASRACRKSIMIGTALNKSEMKKLVSHMGELDQPWNCPHGRPTMRHLINLDMLPD